MGGSGGVKKLEEKTRKKTGGTRGWGVRGGGGRAGEKTACNQIRPDISQPTRVSIVLFYINIGGE